MLRRMLLWAVLACLTSACLPLAAAAYTYSGQAWCCDTVYYHVNPTGPSSSCGGTPGWSFNVRVNMAATAWNNLGTTFKLVSSGTTATGCVGPGGNGNCYGPHDGQNTISMATGCNWSDNNVIAYSTWWYWTGGDSAGCITEGDICFNDEVTWYNSAGNCTGNCYDLVAVAEHELGHWLSADHENDSAVLGYRPVMYWMFNYCEQRRAITPDDSALVFWAYGPNNVISLPSRFVSHHDHPPYDPPPAHQECFPLACNNLDWDPCLLVCPASDITYTVTATINGHPVCASDVLSLVFPTCPVDSCTNEEPNWPYVFPDSCNPATGVHYFTVDAKLLDCVTCEAWLTLSTMWCGPITARFLDNDGDGCVTEADYDGGRLCDDFNCDFAGGPGDQAIWAAHFGHCCGGTCCVIRGDIDHSGSGPDIADLVYLVTYMFGGGPQAPCAGETDINGDGTGPDIADLVYLVTFMFGGGPIPVPCP